MSLIGKKPIQIPDKVKIKIESGKIFVEGPKGKLDWAFPSNVEVKADNSSIIVKRLQEDKAAFTMHGLTRAYINNMVKGVSLGFEKVLEIFHSKGKKVMQGDTKAGQNESIRKVDGMVSVEANLYSEDLVALLDKNNKFNSEKLKKIMADIANRKAEINGDSTAAIKSILVDAKIFESDLA